MSPGRTFAAEPGRLDVTVAARLGIPRAEAQRLIAAGAVHVDGRARPKSHRLAGGERVEVEVAASAGPPPEGPPLEIRYRDEHLAVVSKPSGIATHPTANRPAGTVVNRLLGMGVPLAPRGGLLRPGIVHRLDVGTSGLLVVALDDRTHAGLSESFRRHEADRRYLALVRGAVPHERFEVEAPLGRRGARIRVDAAGRAAATGFEIRDRFERATLLQAAPRTGRTHQIRVHLAAVGHPILGDRRYGGAGPDATALGLIRPFLHAWQLTLDHPITGRRIRIEEPLPPDLGSALRILRSG